MHWIVHGFLVCLPEAWISGLYGYTYSVPVIKVRFRSSWFSYLGINNSQKMVVDYHIFLKQTRIPPDPGLSSRYSMGSIIM